MAAAMAGDLRELVRILGHDTVHVAGHDPLRVWERWADPVTGAVIGSGHHMAEEAPEQVADAIAAIVR